MARSNTGNVIQFLALGALTIGIGTAIGYYVIGGTHSGQPPAEVSGIQEAPVPSSPPASPPPPKVVRKRLTSDYTAPGAPRIHIIEGKASGPDAPPHARSAGTSPEAPSSTDIPTPDVEASQEGRAPVSVSSSDTTPAVTTGASDTGAAPKTKPSADTEASRAGTTAATSGSPDTNNLPAASAATTDPEASQAGVAANTGKTGGKAQYRVQAGSFADAGNARDYVNSLHDQGYDANLHTEHQGEKTVYKVQVGAFRNRSDADQAAAGFRRKGVPVTVSPVSP